MTETSAETAAAAGFQEKDGRGRIVLCGSMKAISTMEVIGRELMSQGITALVPHRDDPLLETQAEAVLRDGKHRASKLHMSWIVDPATRAILIVNPHREGQPDYIGPNAFGEAAVAFATDRRIFLLNGIPANFEEELSAWRARCLYGDLRPVIGFFRSGHAERSEGRP
ncbi:hypothetical protein [Asanoa iriomotensis]|uniref:Nucleoside 2-deoxyribosyltransferase-like protein n=1 Tax=Asanoa iriomotensis TaxID=234613 RepID=A0ABQ4BXK9_9ACTN|nr:hypothetical protein [Asanoa iriomotensis]GIF55259.1 hypothetical protein Air01nite_13540 [Asanoa iriomotensis]